MNCLARHVSELGELSQSHADDRVRFRAAALLRLANGQKMTEVTRDLGCSNWQLEQWSERFVSDGRAGLDIRPRPGRPTLLDAEALALLESALAISPLEYGYAAEHWTITDLRDLLRTRGWHVGYETVARALHRMGYRYRLTRSAM